MTDGIKEAIRGCRKQLPKKNTHVHAIID